MTHLRLVGRSACAIGLVALFAAPTPLSAASATITAPPDTISPVGTAPNYFHNPGISGNDLVDSITSSFADPANGLLFEFNAYGFTTVKSCPTLAALNIDNYAVVATNGRTSPSGDCTPTAQIQGVQGPVGGGSKAQLATVDSTDKLLFFGDGFDATAIDVLDEESLSLVTVWHLPAQTPGDPRTQAQKKVSGLSWHAASDQLIVTSSNGSASAGAEPGVSVTAYSIPQGLLASSSGGVALWTRDITECLYPLVPQFFTAAAYRSHNGDSVFVPCSLVGGGSATVDEKDGIVKLSLSSTADQGQPCPTSGICPTQVAVAPGPTNDLLFDAQSDRGFMPVQIADGISMLVYDGKQQNFIGRTGIGTKQDTNVVAFGVDGVTGRVYAVAPSSGMTVVDGRRTPVSAGDVFPQYTSTPNYVTFPILPSDSVWPYPRVVVPQTSMAKDGSGGEPYYRVYADTRAVSQDPPPPDPDLNTLRGAIPPGAIVTKAFGGNARGFAFHSDFVGGLNGAEANAHFSLGLPQLNVPLGSGNRDVMGGAVPDLGVNNGQTHGRSSALADANGSTAFGFYQCSDLSRSSDCTAQPIPAAPPALTPAQAWPYPDAACSQPGTTDEQSWPGAYQTGYDASGKPVQHLIPGTDASSASVNCIANDHSGGVEGAAQFATAGFSFPNAPTFSIASGYTASWTSPATATAGVESHALAVVRGVRVDDGLGQSLSIDTISQEADAAANGRAATAATTDTVVQGVAITQGGTTTPLCTGTCAGGLQQVVNAINNAFPTLIRVSQPKPDSTFVHDDKSGNGSPGGYTAVVQRDPIEQYGDIQFNGMTPEEASLLPALRIVLYDDGRSQVDREVLDLAGVATDAEVGLSMLSSPTFDDFSCPPVVAGVAQPTRLAATGAGAMSAGTAPSTPTAPSTQSAGPVCATAASAAGLTSYTPTTPETAGTSGTPGSNNSSGGGSGDPGSGVYHAVVKFLQGLSWLWRSPAVGLQMLSFLLLLGLPLMLMARRRLWLHDQTMASA